MKRINTTVKERKVKRRPGCPSKKKSSNNKNSKCYKKKYRGQGKTRR
jgi:hypothetical protein